MPAVTGRDQFLRLRQQGDVAGAAACREPDVAVVPAAGVPGRQTRQVRTGADLLPLCAERVKDQSPAEASTYHGTGSVAENRPAEMGHHAQQ